MFHEFIYEFWCTKVPDACTGRLAREAAELRELLRLEALAMTHYFKFKHTKIERLFKLSK